MLCILQYKVGYRVFLLQKEGDYMFSDEILEEIYSSPETKNVSICEQSIMINVIASVLERKGVDFGAALCQSELSQSISA